MILFLPTPSFPCFAHPLSTSPYFFAHLRYTHLFSCMLDLSSGKMAGNTCYVGWICFNPINLTIVAINVSFNGTLFIKWSFTVWWSPNHHWPPRAPWFVCKELLLELLKLHVKAYLVLLLVPSQEVLLQKYTETWEQWRAERPRDFEETGWGGGGEVEGSDTAEQEWSQICNEALHVMIKTWQKQNFISVTEWRRITNDILSLTLAKNQDTIKRR